MKALSIYTYMSRPGSSQMQRIIRTISFKEKKKKSLESWSKFLLSVLKENP